MDIAKLDWIIIISFLLITLFIGILAMLLALVIIYCLLFATGYFIYGNLQLGGMPTTIAIISAYLLSKVWSRIKVKVF